MNYDSVRERLRSVAVTTVTPFTTDLVGIDTAAISENVEFLQQHGIKLIVPCGNTGEFYSLSETEWTKVAAATIDAASGDLAVMVGVGGAITTAKQQIQQAESLGADAVMILYPQHVFKSEEGLLNYYNGIIEFSKEIPIVLYKKGPLLSNRLLAKLADNEKVVGVKYAFGRIVDFARAIQNVGKSIIWTCGTAERFAPFFWLAGAEGFTSGLANFAPTVSLDLYNALRNGNWRRAMEIQKMIAPLEFLREERGTANNVPVIKTAMDYLGLAGGSCRPPIHQLSIQEKQAVFKIIDKWEIPSAT